MFSRKVALRPVPTFARVEPDTVADVERVLEDSDDLQDALDRALDDMESAHPALSQWMSSALEEVGSELCQSVGYFLSVSVFMMFRESFGSRLGHVRAEAVGLAVATLETDEALREADPAEVLQSDDVIALGQPVVMEYVQHHVREALDQAEDGDVVIEDMERVYRALLVEVIALSHSVTAPDGSARVFS